MIGLLKQETWDETHADRSWVFVDGSGMKKLGYHEVSNPEDL